MPYTLLGEKYMLSFSETCPQLMFLSDATSVLKMLSSAEWLKAEAISLFIIFTPFAGDVMYVI